MIISNYKQLLYDELNLNSAGFRFKEEWSLRFKVVNHYGSQITALNGQLSKDMREGNCHHQYLQLYKEVN